MQTTEAPKSISLAALQEHLPSFLTEVSFLGLELWQWCGIVLLVPVAWLLARLASGLLRALLQPVVRRTETTLDDEILRVLLPPARLLIGVGFFLVGSMLLELSDTAYRLLGHAEVALVVTALAWIALCVVDILARVLRERLTSRGRTAAISVVPLGVGTAKGFLLVLAVLAMLQNLGVNITGLIAGLGVGGLAVALAAQKTVANLFGGVMLVADQPIQVGDFCRFGADKLGTVEEIGLRSTRVRTLDRTLVTIPNSEFSEIQLENFAARDRIRVNATLGLRYETSPDQLRHVLAELRKLLIAHPKVTDAPARVRFVGFGSHSLDLEVFAYVLAIDYDEFLKVREDLYLRFMDIVAASGTGFAFPSQTLYLGRDGGLDATATRRAEEQVAAWRERGELPFPDFGEETVSRLEDSADYPPRGSVDAAKADPASG